MQKFGHIIIFIVKFSLWLFLISSLWPKPLVLTTALLIGTFVYFLFFKKRGDEIFFVTAAIFGPIGEAVVSSSGLWKYNGQTIFGIPCWLPLAWGLTALLIKNLITNLTTKS